MIDKVYIVFYQDDVHHFIESVWSSRELAQSAIHYHAHRSNKGLRYYFIIERDINKTINQ